jgi:hypothetical protein
MYSILLQQLLKIKPSPKCQIIGGSLMKGKVAGALNSVIAIGLKAVGNSHTDG